MDPRMITLGQAAARRGVPVWMPRRLYERALLPPASRVDTVRVLDADELPAIEAILRRVGYLPQTDGPAGAGCKIVEPSGPDGDL